jgi:probable HAF family extracellular repeat protein
MQAMKNCIALGVSSFSLLLCVVTVALADNYNYTTIDFPGAVESGAVGINNLGQIVGGYQLGDGSRHGFLLSGGVFSTVDDPSATSGSENVGINNSGQIVGAYDLNSLEGENTFEGVHGFLYTASTFINIDFPATGVTNTTANRINDSGAIVGVYRIMDGPGNGFLDVSGVFTTVNVPGKVGTHCNGINNAGEIVGQYKDSLGAHHGFLDNGGAFTTIDFAGAAETIVSDIDNFGDIVGAYKTTMGEPFGFLNSGGNLTTIAFPGALETFALGINDQGDIVGFYRDQSMVLHGFLATPVSTQENFVIGDGNAVVGNHVTFWGAQWAKANSLSGGSAPASFKGFVKSTSTNPPACGGTWQGTSGNRSKPPRTVPSYITVMVASSATKSRSTISGNIVNTATIKTDPGYGPNPGHAGTGRVVAVGCP